MCSSIGKYTPSITIKSIIEGELKKREKKKELG
jgi:hypothetical protein